MPPKNKKKDKDPKDPQKLKVSPLSSHPPKELGNKAFMNKDYEEALDYYSKAIELDPKEPAFFTNSKRPLTSLHRSHGQDSTGQA